MLDVVDQVFPTVLEKVLHSTPQSEKVQLLTYLRTNIFELLSSVSDVYVSTP